MTREQDWRIHEYMGNDLTGWRWDDPDEQGLAMYGSGDDFRYRSIPHYSTTWEGAGLVMELAAYHEDMVLVYEVTSIDFMKGKVSYEGRFDCMDRNERADSLPGLVANAFIAAMEERDNG